MSTVSRGGEGGRGRGRRSINAVVDGLVERVVGKKKPNPAKGKDDDQGRSVELSANDDANDTVATNKNKKNKETYQPQTPKKRIKLVDSSEQCPTGKFKPLTSPIFAKPLSAASLPKIPKVKTATAQAKKNETLVPESPTPIPLTPPRIETEAHVDIGDGHVQELVENLAEAMCERDAMARKLSDCQQQTNQLQVALHQMKKRDENRLGNMKENFRMVLAKFGIDECDEWVLDAAINKDDWSGVKRMVAEKREKYEREARSNKEMLLRQNDTVKREVDSLLDSALEQFQSPLRKLKAALKKIREFPSTGNGNTEFGYAAPESNNYMDTRAESKKALLSGPPTLFHSNGGGEKAIELISNSAQPNSGRGGYTNPANQGAYVGQQNRDGYLPRFNRGAYSGQPGRGGYSSQAASGGFTQSSRGGYTQQHSRGRGGHPPQTNFSYSRQQTHNGGGGMQFGGASSNDRMQQQQQRGSPHAFTSKRQYNPSGPREEDKIGQYQKRQQISYAELTGDPDVAEEVAAHRQLW